MANREVISPFHLLPTDIFTLLLYLALGKCSSWKPSCEQTPRWMRHWDPRTWKFSHFMHIFKETSRTCEKSDL